MIKALFTALLLYVGSTAAQVENTVAPLPSQTCESLPFNLEMVGIKFCLKPTVLSYVNVLYADRPAMSLLYNNEEVFIQVQTFANFTGGAQREVQLTASDYIKALKFKSIDKLNYTTLYQIHELSNSDDLQLYENKTWLVAVMQNEARLFKEALIVNKQSQQMLQIAGAFKHTSLTEFITKIQLPN
ncbi:hypothetical protein ACFOEE_00550 [Pseudoalteromonas fenneropenaei]|uniref:DUF4154 domain-containing protein n=1 Tax=Pseudoalteromonas fenneropenaei TaxID=1737459 RepID=A0ABV7CET1_9GAMM